MAVPTFSTRKLWPTVQGPTGLQTSVLGEPSRLHGNKHAGPLILPVPFKDRVPGCETAGPKLLQTDSVIRIDKRPVGTPGTHGGEDAWQCPALVSVPALHLRDGQCYPVTPFAHPGPQASCLSVLVTSVSSGMNSTPPFFAGKDKGWGGHCSLASGSSSAKMRRESAPREDQVTDRGYQIGRVFQPHVFLLPGLAQVCLLTAGNK